MVVERLTKQNHDLEEQLCQKEAGPNLQEQNQEGNSAERREQRKPKGSNAPSRPERQNVSLPSLMDFAPPANRHRDAGDEGADGGHDERPQGVSIF